MTTPSVADLVAAATKAVEGEGATSDQTSTETPQTEPPEWQMILDALPESLYPTVTPVLEKYSEFQKSKYEDELKKYDPWKDVTGEHQPDDVIKALEFAQQFDANPVAVYQALEEHLVNMGLLETEVEVSTPGEVQKTPKATESSEEVDEEVLNHPAYKALQSQMEQFQQGMQQLLEMQQAQQQNATEAEEMEMLEAYLEDLNKRHGDLDEDFMIAKLSQGVDGEDAAKQWRAIVERGTAPKPGEGTEGTAPPVLGGGNSLPSNRIPNPGKLNRSQTNDLVVEILKAQAGNQ